MQVKPFDEAVNRYQQKYGKRAAETLSILGKRVDFVQAFENKLGQELLADAIERIQYLLEKVYNEEATDIDRADMRAYKRIVDRWVNRINDYNNKVGEIEKH